MNNKLTNVTIPNSVTKIRLKAFEGCESLEDIAIPDSVQTIEFAAFEGCTSLVHFEFLGRVELDDGTEEFLKYSKPAEQAKDRGDKEEHLRLWRLAVEVNEEACGQTLFSGCSRLISIKRSANKEGGYLSKTGGTPFRCPRCNKYPFNYKHFGVSKCKSCGLIIEYEK